MAVVRCEGGNHAAETNGGAAMATGPPSPVINCPKWIRIDWDLLSSEIHLKPAPMNSKKAARTTEALRPTKKLKIYFFVSEQ